MAKRKGKSKKRRFRRAAAAVGRRVRRGARRARRKIGAIPLPAKFALGLGLGVPPAVNMISGAKAFFQPQIGGKTPDLWGRIALAVGVAADDFATGWGFGQVFGTVKVTNTDGSVASHNTQTWTTMPPGGSMVLAITGTMGAAFSLGLSWLARKVTGKKAIKIAGQTIG